MDPFDNDRLETLHGSYFSQTNVGFKYSCWGFIRSETFLLFLILLTRNKLSLNLFRLDELVCPWDILLFEVIFTAFYL